MLQECRSAPLLLLETSARPLHFALPSLTKSLPGSVSSGRYADLADKVTPVDRLSPISAALAAYHRARRARQGNGVHSMKDVTAASANNSNAHPSSDEHTALHLCYRQIGISAVAAAARYNGEAKIPALARIAVGTDEPTLY